MAKVSYPFKKTNKALFLSSTSAVTQDSLYWKKLGVSSLYSRCVIT